MFELKKISRKIIILLNKKQDKVFFIFMFLLNESNNENYFHTLKSFKYQYANKSLSKSMFTKIN